MVTLRLRGVPVRAAIASVARAAGATATVVEGVEGPVSLSAEAMPVEDALDAVAAQVNGRWRVRYQFLPGEPPMAALDAGRSTLDGGSAPRQPRVFVRPVSLTPPPDEAPLQTGTRPAASRLGDGVLRQLLTGDLARLLATGPKGRREAVQSYARRLKAALQTLGALSPEERAAHLAPLRPLLRSGIRALDGLTPDQQQEFLPVTELLRRWLP